MGGGGRLGDFFISSSFSAVWAGEGGLVLYLSKFTYVARCSSLRMWMFQYYVY